MFSNILKPWVLAPVLAAACALAQASPVPVGLGAAASSADLADSETSTLYAGAPVPGSAVTGGFTLQSAIAAPASEAETEAAPSVFSASSLAQPNKRALAQASDAESRREAFELALWSFVKNIRAQQQGEHFELFQSTVDLHEFKINSAGDISAVPLPGAAWLFVMGVLGLAGSRVTRVAGGAEGAKEQGARDAFAGAVPA